MFEAKVLTNRWMNYYNNIRSHSSLGGKTPAPQTVVYTKDGINVVVLCFLVCDVYYKIFHSIRAHEHRFTFMFTRFDWVHDYLTVTDFFRCPSLDCKTCRGWLTYCAVR